MEISKALIFASVLILAGGAWLYHRSAFHPQSASQGLTIAEMEARAPAAVTTDQRALIKLAKGVQHYCVDKFELASCLAYATDCGRECSNLLPHPVRQKIKREYNQYLVSQGKKPLPSVTR